jgi:hypothetical protein
MQGASYNKYMERDFVNLSNFLETESLSLHFRVKMRERYNTPNVFSEL